MNLSFKVPTPLDYFGALVQSDAQLHLLEAAISLGQDEYPQLDVQQVLAEVDQLLVRLRQRLPADAPALHRLRMVNHFFFHDLHFGGNLNHYYDPDNSYLHQVLERRRGIPVSLAVLWLELAQGVGLPAHGVGFPGHFMVKVNLPHAQVVIDPFSGQSLGRDELQTRLEAWRGGHGLPAEAELPLGHYLQSLPAREIVARMLRNLKEIHRAQRDWPRLVAVQNRLLVLLPQAWDEYRDRGLAQAELGRLGPALQDLQTYLDQTVPGDDAAAVAARVAALRRALG
jgi:regulator of sirC expression with transglutaminase-like and TPR domain